MSIYLKTIFRPSSFFLWAVGQAIAIEYIVWPTFYVNNGDVTASRASFLILFIKMNSFQEFVKHTVKKEGEYNYLRR